MQQKKTSEATQIINELASGKRSNAEQLFSLLYEDFRSLADRYIKREKSGHTLQPTALVHEAFLKLIDQTRVDWKGKTHFFAVGAQIMRRLLVDHARERQRLKRGGERQRILLSDDVALSPQHDEDLLAVDEVLTKLAQIDPRQAMIVEMRFFGGMNVEEVAQAIGVSKRTVESEWTVVRAWLRRELSKNLDS